MRPLEERGAKDRIMKCHGGLVFFLAILIIPPGRTFAPTYSTAIPPRGKRVQCGLKSSSHHSYSGRRLYRK